MEQEEIKKDEETKETEQQGEEMEETKQDEQPKEESKEQAKYTDADIDEIIQEKFARWQKKQDEEIAEAEKLAKMNEEEKQKYKIEQLEKEVAKYQQSEKMHEMSRVASNMLADENINASEDLLNLIVADTADDTKKQVNAFIELVNDVTDQKVKERLAGNTPIKRSHSKIIDDATVEKFENMSYQEKSELQRSKPEVYNKLMKKLKGE